jgi:hypothetical protein
LNFLYGFELIFDSEEDEGSDLPESDNTAPTTSAAVSSMTCLIYSTTTALLVGAAAAMNGLVRL